MRPGFRMSMGAQWDDVARVNAAFAAFAAEQQLPAEARRSLQVALDELLSNIVSHGLAGREGGEAMVEVARSPDGLVVTVSDNGPPFDPFRLDAPDTTSPVEARPVGGLGIHLVRQMVDEANYDRRGDRNVIVLTKRLTGDTSRSHPGGE